MAVKNTCFEEISDVMLELEKTFPNEMGIIVPKIVTTFKKGYKKAIGDMMDVFKQVESEENDG